MREQRSDREIVKPIAFAVLRLIPSLNLVGCSIKGARMLVEYRSGEPSDPMRAPYRLRLGGKRRGDEAGRNGADELPSIHPRITSSTNEISTILRFPR